VVVAGQARQRRSRLIAGTLAQLTAASKALTPLTRVLPTPTREG
jgi:hypothetical protein